MSLPRGALHTTAEALECGSVWVYVPDESEESDDHHDERVLRQCLKTSFAHQSSSLHTHGTEWRLLSAPEVLVQAGLAAEAVVTSNDDLMSTVEAINGTQHSTNARI